MRHVLTGAAMLLVAGATAACGSGAPTDASADEFCETYVKRYELKDPSADDIQDYADELEETGTPDDASDEEREGFEIQLDYLKDIKNDEDIEKLQEEDSDLSKDDEEKAEAFDKYASKKCEDEINEALGVPDSDEVPTDPGDIETDDIPSDGASDLPIDPDEMPSDPEEMESYLEELESEMADMSESP
jgi:hypothetical protein